MTLRQTPMVCRLLLVCFLCTLWCRVVIAAAPATPKEKVQEVAGVVKKSLETTQKILADLKTAENCVNKQEDIENENSGNDLTSYYENTTRNGEELSQAVKKAAVAAEGVVSAVKAVEQQLTEGELKELMTDAVQNADNLLTAVKNANTKAQEIHATLQTSDIVNVQGLAADQMNSILPLLEVATNAANLTDQFFQDAVKKVAVLEQNLQEDPKDSSTSPAQTQNVAKSSESGMEETQHTDTLHDLEVQFSSWPRNNNPSLSDTRRKMPCERMTISDFIHDDNGTDRTHDGAVTAWAQSPLLLLLLTAVAYAAVC